MARHFSSHMNTQSCDCFSAQVLQVTSRILNFVEDALNTLSKMVQQALKRRRILLMLVDALGRKHLIARGAEISVCQSPPIKP
jgi:hypothetical protein